MRQTVIGVLLLVALGLFWQRGDGSVGPDDKQDVQSSDDALGEAKLSDAVARSEAVPTREQPTAGANADFAYYVLVLSWSPTHCSGEAGRGRDDDLQCRSGRPYGFVLHGLWPQHERGYPQNCSSGRSSPVSDLVMTQALKLTPSRELVEHEWSKHGTCSGLSEEDYFATAALAVETVTVPSVYHALQRPVVTTPNDVRRAFLDANRLIPKDGLSATCSRNKLAEVWVCLDKGLRPRACSNDVRKRHCGGREVRMLAVRGDWPR
jgi:ribonuclease T2